MGSVIDATLWLSLWRATVQNPLGPYIRLELFRNIIRTNTPNTPASFRYLLLVLISGIPLEMHVFINYYLFWKK